MNADGLLNRVLLQTTGDRAAAEGLLTEFWIALVGDWCARKDFYAEIAQRNPDTAQLWALMLPSLDQWLIDLCANGYHDDANVDPNDPVNAFMADHPDALNPLLYDFPDPLTDDEIIAVGDVLGWDDEDAV